MMKKILVLLAISCMATAAMAQTEKGSFRIGGATNLGFVNTKLDGADDSANTFNLNLDGGYFVANNFSLNLGVGLDYSKQGDVSSTTFGVGLDLRYYLPVKVFVGAGFDLINTKTKIDNVGSVSGTGTGVNLTAGYAAFVSDHFAIEPALYYRLGLSDKDKGTKANAFGVQVGLGYYF